MESGAWELRLLGPPSLIGQGRTVLLERKPAALLAYLALEGPTPRSKLAGLLWPEGSEASARNNLRQTLFTLRRYPGLFGGSDPLSLSPLVRSDVAALQNRVASGEGRGLELQGELLEGHDYDDCPEFEEWLIYERERLQELRIEALNLIAERLEREGKLAEALSWAQKLLEEDPLSEAAHRRLMRLHYLLGDRAAALRAYARCVEALQRELGVEPLPETRSLAQEIERGGLAPQPALIRKRIPLSVERPPVLVGREREWALMEQAWERGELIVISGEPGMGKTRLALEFVASKGLPIVFSGRPGDASVPYATHARAFRRLLGEKPGLELAPWVRRELSRILPELAGEPPPLQSEADKLRFFEAQGELLRLASQDAAAWVLDDLHFFDLPSLEVAFYLAGKPGLLPRVIQTYRLGELPPEAARRVRQLEEAGMLRSIRLEPLSEEAVRLLLLELRIPGLERHLDSLMSLTGGNPLFLLETIRHLIETDRLEQGWSGQGGLPGKVGSIISRRLEGLSTEALQLARLVGVAGSDFSLEFAARLLGRDLLSLLPAWEELERAQLVRGERFSHDLILEAVVAGMPQGVGALLHRRVATWLAQEKANPARVAEHWLAGGEPERAVPFLLEAARRAEHASLLGEALRFYRQAAQILQDHGTPEQMFDVQEAIAVVRLRLEPAESHQALLEPLFGLARTPHQKARAHYARASALLRTGRGELVEEAARSGYELAVQSGDPSLEARLLTSLASAQWLKGQPGETLTLLERALVLYERLGDHEELAANQGRVAVVLDALERHREALEHHRKAEVALRRLGNEYRLLIVLNNQAVSLGALGYKRRVCEVLQEAMGLVDTLQGVGELAVSVPMLLGDALRDLGDYGGALHYLELAHARAKEQPYWRVGFLAKALALAYLDLGQPARAQSVLEALHPEALQPDQRSFLRLAWLRLAQWRGYEAGELLRELEAGLGPSRSLRTAFYATRAALLPLEEGLSWARQALELSQQADLGGLQIVAHTRVAQVLLALGRPEEALPHAQAALELRATYDPSDFYWGEVLLAHARTLEALKHPEAASQRRQAQSWVGQTAEGVPAEYRESFLRHNPVNVALLEPFHAPHGSEV
ncbi:ATP-binding protein [Calidithermus roseus]|uniref:Bacterial transcriptional activator domain protein n=1 Tax=Calidithermus roseus TaxID=1644118 RepID=A0A399F3N0_9DEIN|nr:BTAD domain-containing putative transcriptional regulator [Calidithermus roseus]RIH89472.1 Bacterial transcriptional activator domain protein [Calidithermus roseus]